MSEQLISQAAAEIDYTDSCGNCKRIQKTYKINSPHEDGFAIHMERCSLTGRRNKDKEQKKKYRHRTEKIVSALRNTSGGVLLIHIQGQRPGDKYLEYFDEFISESLHYMTDHGQLYINTYRRHWLDEIPVFRDIHDFILLKVSKSIEVSTLDFNTKIRNDHENKSPLVCNVMNILSSSTAPSAETTLESVSHAQTAVYSIVNQIQEEVFNVQDLHENRSIELKAFKPSKPIRDVPALVNYIWEDLKLKYNVASLSKVTGGGYYYVGISERSQKDEYVTKNLTVDGVTLEFSKTEIRQQLTTMILNSTVAYKTGSGFSDTPSDLVDIQFLEASQTTPPRFVLRLFVKYFEGIIFTDIDGPRTYRLTENKSIERIPREEWHHLFKKSMINSS